MNLIYNSEHYSVVEFGAEAGMETMRFGGYEILDKPARRETFIEGPLAEVFRQHVRQLMAILERLNIAPDTPVTDKDLAGLPMPKGVWE